MSEVEVRIKQRVQDKSMFYEVLVGSETRPGIYNKGILEAGECNVRQKIGLLAGALAEQLCDRYGDTIEPSACAQSAMGAHQDLMAENPHVTLGDELPRDADRAIRAGLVTPN